MTTQEKEGRLEELCEQIEEQEIEFERVSGAVRYHLQQSFHAIVVMAVVFLSMSILLFGFAENWLDIGLCFALEVAGTWNIYDKNRVTEFFIERQSEELQRFDDLIWKLAKLEGNTNLLNFFRMCSGIPPRFD